MTWRRCHRCGDWAECEVTRCGQCVDDAERAARQPRALPQIRLPSAPKPAPRAAEPLDLFDEEG